MPTYVALLRGINVGGRNLVAMSDLRELFETLGFAGAKSLLQSGNVVFKSDRLTGAKLEKLLERETAARLGVAAGFVVRSAAEIQQVVVDNPFPKEAKVDPGHLVVMFLKAAPEPEKVRALQAAIKGPEYMRCNGNHLHVVYPDGIGRSKLTSNLIEQKLGTRGTGRNWNTVLKLAGQCQ
jgi:uncharacterized protein (DUF1697 family)